jgi:hypothetical protein
MPTRIFPLRIWPPSSLAKLISPQLSYTHANQEARKNAAEHPRLKKFMIISPERNQAVIVLVESIHDGLFDPRRADSTARAE